MTGGSNFDYHERDGHEKPAQQIAKAVAIEYERGVDEAPRVTASGKGALAEQILAIAFERGVDEAPRVTASGKGALAEQILAIAFERGIKVREDAELVEILSLVDVDSPIPLEAFGAVAEILAYVYQANDLKKPRPPAWKEGM